MARALATEEKRELHILLLGKTGVGKSSTGNCILGNRKFTVSGRGISETADIQQAWVETDRFIVKVIDGPGLEDTQMTRTQDRERVCKSIEKALAECGTGVNAFVYVTAYGSRFTKEDKDAVESLKKMIGDERMGDFSVVVLTRGSEWKEDYGNSSFQQWCEQNDENYNGIFSFCGNRCVLFENRKSDASQKADQVKELMILVENIANKNGFYTNYHFDGASLERAKMILEMKAPELKKKFQTEVNSLTENMLEINKNVSKCKKMKDLGQVIEQANELVTRIEKEDKQSGLLKDVKSSVQNIITAAKVANEQCLDELAYIEIKKKKDSDTCRLL